jgi:lipoprotein-anchoring transpeptidase ErfK/SrfK
LVNQQRRSRAEEFFVQSFLTPNDKNIEAMSSISKLIRCAAAIASLSCSPTRAQQMFTSFVQPPQMQISPPAGSPDSLQLESAPDEGSESVQLSARLQRQIVRFPSHEAPGTIIIDTPNTFLYYILGNGKAIRVSREGFTWSGVKSVTRKAEWPDWYPPAQMIIRQPYLPRMVAGGPGNPLGARALHWRHRIPHSRH